ncbi:FGGY-family carbohydrate kinase [Tropicimonas sediminicola]|uniref:FGGY-family pentulose kinase n=1 Tax=Tropicimonas sediminicola TaxID=1031541 RepID=A0A239LEN2_9RHOB|nr:FGGY-family carbohydrate kinase [Tropicimonas sediminicola]SNT28368.1 FGGY-family pentulose kinase [Tropicimonas sediminicola]
MTFYLGIDVGTGSARAGVFDASGKLLGVASRETAAFRPQPDFIQQSSADIWEAICVSVRAAMAQAGLSPAEIGGIGFDATCSLVVCDADGKPVSVSPDGAREQDIILWMDHRAVADADAINATGADVLRYVGNVISPEMEMPKLRWLKRNLPEAWARAGLFFDLPDWLVWRATGSQVRSLCSSTCKWTYMAQKGRGGEGWDDAFLAEIGLEELAGAGHGKIGTEFLSPEESAGCLDSRAAEELGLAEGTPVAAGLIDAYSGALGTLGAMPGGAALTERMAVIAGTSTCHITVTPEPAFVPGVWGPYYSVLLPELWALEGGQSAAGALIDAVVARHSAGAALCARAEVEGRSIHALLAEVLAGMGEETAVLTTHRHVQPDFHGNRAPLADPTRRGAISGLSLDHGGEDLALDYLATLQALSYGTRHVLEEMAAQGVKVTTMVVSGGLARNTLFLREMADACGCKVIVPEQKEPVLLGSAMLGAVAGGRYADLPAAMAAMSGPGIEIAPRTGKIAAFHDRKYLVFRRMQEDFAAYAALMEGKAD